MILLRISDLPEGRATTPGLMTVASSPDGCSCKVPLGGIMADAALKVLDSLEGCPASEVERLARAVFGPTTAPDDNPSDD